MKAVFPKNIQKWLLAWLTLNVGPISISIIQLFILALGVAWAFAIFNQFQKTNKVVWALAAVFVFLIFLIIAFFKISEMNLLEFIVKFIQSHFIDTSQKIQTNYKKISSLLTKIQKSKAEEWKQKIEYKTGISLDGVDVLDRSWLL